jgi:hypothetical protein
VRLRQGRRNGRNLYLQLGPEPHETDPCLGFIIDPRVCADIVNTMNCEDRADPIRHTLAEPED